MEAKGVAVEFDDQYRIFQTRRWVEPFDATERVMEAPALDIQ